MPFFRSKVGKAMANHLPKGKGIGQQRLGGIRPPVAQKSVSFHWHLSEATKSAASAMGRMKSAWSVIFRRKETIVADVMARAA